MVIAIVHCYITDLIDTGSYVREQGELACRLAIFQHYGTCILPYPIQADLSGNSHSVAAIVNRWDCRANTSHTRVILDTDIRVGAVYKHRIHVVNNLDDLLVGNITIPWVAVEVSVRVRGLGSLSGTWLGGGAPQPGIAIGNTETFTFNVTATDAASLTEGSFLEGPYAFDFVVRFRGLNNGGSDKVPTPTPGPVALAGIAGLVATRRRR